MTVITSDADVRDAHDRFLTAGSSSPHVRSLVADSWARSLAAGVDVDEPSAPLVRDTPALREYREAHPLSQVFPLLYDVLGRAAEECDSVMAVGDAHGQLLWVCGSSLALTRAENIRFVEGARWDEASVGTNAPGTALRLDVPVQIRAGEHFARPVQPWSCAAAPIHDPTSRAIIGIVDVTGGDEIGTPQTLAMVRAAARMAEAELGRIAATRLWLPGEGAEVVALGRPDCEVHACGGSIRLSRRHSEILVLLADHPDGLTGDELAIELYCDDVSTSTMRAELTRLRHLLGPDVLDSRPYRLRNVRCDWIEVTAALDAERSARRDRAQEMAGAAAARRGAHQRRRGPDGRVDTVAVGRRRRRHVAPAGSAAPHVVAAAAARAGRGRPPRPRAGRLTRRASQRRCNVVAPSVGRASSRTDSGGHR